MVSFAGLSLSPEHATLLFVINFVGAYLIARYGGLSLRRSESRAEAD